MPLGSSRQTLQGKQKSWSSILENGLLIGYDVFGNTMTI